MTEAGTIAIVGAGMAGGKAAETLRAEGYDGCVVLLGAERERPYERPPLSKKLLAGEVEEHEIFLQSPEWYAEQRIELRTGARAVALHPDAREVELQSGERVGYDRLLLATGASPRKLRVDGTDLAGVHYLRQLSHARRLRDDLASAERVVVIGMGFIGAEIAAVARTLGRQVVALEAAAQPMLALGAEVGARLAQVHRDRGVDVRCNARVTGLLGMERVERVITEDGGIDADLVVIGIGVAPETRWLESSGIELDGGVVTDELCRTSLPDVFAAGDIAASYNPRYGRRLHVEHHDNAALQGVAAAKAMLGGTQPYAPIPYVWSDQYDFAILVAGDPEGCDEVVFRGTVASGSWSAFYLRDGVFQAVLTLDRARDFSAARRLLDAGTPVTAAQLADEGVELRSLLG